MAPPHASRSTWTSSVGMPSCAKLAKTLNPAYTILSRTENSLQLKPYVTLKSTNAQMPPQRTSTPHDAFMRCYYEELPKLPSRFLHSVQPARMGLRPSKLIPATVPYNRTSVCTRFTQSSTPISAAAAYTRHRRHRMPALAQLSVSSNPPASSTTLVGPSIPLINRTVQCLSRTD